MTILLPILFVAVIVGLSSQRITRMHWAAMTAWILAVVVFNYLRH